MSYVEKFEKSEKSKELVCLHIANTLYIIYLSFTLFSYNFIVVLLTLICLICSDNNTINPKLSRKNRKIDNGIKKFQNIPTHKRHSKLQRACFFEPGY